MKIEIELVLSEAERLALEHEAPDPAAWARGALEARARAALREIVREEVVRRMATAEPMPPTAEALLREAYAERRRIRAADRLSAGAPDEAETIDHPAAAGFFISGDDDGI